MKMKIDKELDILYIRFDDDKIIESELKEKDLILDYNENGKVVGLELLNLSSRAKSVNFNNLVLETV
ncbi:MAG: DUF2283 domain-containing protein [Candidatus Kapaibacteriota bacterium]|jgi:uncharacterized protein YuzE